MRYDCAGKKPREGRGKIPARSISHCQGKGSLTHNNREFTFKNVDPERTKNNVTYASLPLDEAYEHCFGAAVQRFNDKQKRADRRIQTSYYEELFGKAQQSTVATSANKQKSFYETLVQIGTKDDSGVGSADGELAANCLDEYMRGFQGRNPNFYVFNAVLHMDEATPHLHIDYIPVGHYSRGMDTQNGIAQALKEMGYGTGKDAINRWRLAERKALEDICKQYGVEIAEPQKARGYSLTTHEFKEQIEAEKGQALKEVEEAKKEAVKVNRVVNALKTQREDMQGEIGTLQGTVTEARKMAADVQSDVNALKKQKKAIQGEIEALKSERTVIEGKLNDVIGEASEQSVILAIKERSKTTISGRASYTLADSKILIDTALQRAEVDEETANTQKENKRLKSKVKLLTDEKKILEQKVEALTPKKTPAIDLSKKEMQAAFTNARRRMSDEELINMINTHVPEDELRELVINHVPKKELKTIADRPLRRDMTKNNERS
jgi:hypothetical protein